MEQKKESNQAHVSAHTAKREANREKLKQARALIDAKGLVRSALEGRRELLNHFTRWVERFDDSTMKRMVAKAMVEIMMDEVLSQSSFRKMRKKLTSE
jgi:hypothetical protein